MDELKAKQESLTRLEEEKFELLNKRISDLQESNTLLKTAAAGLKASISAQAAVIRQLREQQQLIAQQQQAQ